jgi:hypothetical protein
MIVGLAMTGVWVPIGNAFVRREGCREGTACSLVGVMVSHLSMGLL